MRRSAVARWNGGFKSGVGNISTDSHALSEHPYSFTSRFSAGVESANTTNPEELIAAAHAGCFTMALAAEVEKAGATAEVIQTIATVVLDQEASGWRINDVELQVSAHVPNIKNDQFQQLVQNAKDNCPVSKLLKANIQVKASLLTGIEAMGQKVFEVGTATPQNTIAP